MSKKERQGGIDQKAIDKDNSEYNDAVKDGKFMTYIGRKLKENRIAYAEDNDMQDIVKYMSDVGFSIQDITDTKLQSTLDSSEANPKKLELIEVKNKRNENIRKFNDVWGYVYGWRFYMSFCYHDRNSITTTSFACERNKRLMNMCDGHIQSVFDVFVGKGSDFFTWAMIPGIQKIMGCVSKIDQYVFLFNLFNFKCAWKKYKRNVSEFPLLSLEFKQDDLRKNGFEGLQFPTDIPRFLDILYIDPPWVFDPLNKQPIYDTLSESEKKRIEAGAADVLTFVQDQIITPILESNVEPQYIVLKGRWKLNEMLELQKHISGYLLQDDFEALSFANAFQTYIFRLDKVNKEKYSFGKWHKDTYFEGKHLKPSDSAYNYYDSTSNEGTWKKTANLSRVKTP
jgi:hypothetical protein